MSFVTTPLSDHDHAALDSMREVLRDKLTGCGSEILGAQLAPMINESFDPKSGVTYKRYEEKLGDFVSNHLSDFLVKTDKRSGADVQYAVKLSADAMPSGALENEGIWRAFVAIHSPVAVAWQSNTRKLILVNRDASAQDLTLIASTSLEEHARLAAEFCDSDFIAGNGNADQLKKIAQNYSDSVYPDWMTAVKAAGKSSLRDWTEFRRDKLRALFKERLQKIKLSGEDSQLAIGQLERDAKRHADVRRKAQTPTDLDSVKASRPESNRRLISLRELAVLLVGQMDNANLRELRVPLGAVLDALGITDLDESRR